MRFPSRVPILFAVFTLILFGVSGVSIWLIREKQFPEVLATKTFPELEVIGGLPPNFNWVCSNGPDFYIYYGVTENENSPGIGVYFGSHPKFHPNSGAPAVQGRLAGMPIEWQRSESQDFPYSVDGLIRYKHSSKSKEILLHAWVRAKSERSLQEVLLVLTSARFQNRTPQTDGPAQP